MQSLWNWKRGRGTHRLTISFSLQIPVFSGNEISFRNFGKFRRISVNFGRIFLNFEFSNEIFRKIPIFFFPVTSENEIFRRISVKFRRNFKPCSRHAKLPCQIFWVLHVGALITATLAEPLYIGGAELGGACKLCTSKPPHRARPENLISMPASDHVAVVAT